MTLTIVTSHWNEDLEWLKKSKWPVVLIDKEGAEPTTLPAQHVIPNVGRETSVYFKYIIENYENLPDSVAFLHGHEEAYHQFHGRHLLEVIEKANYDKYEFISLNNYYRNYPFVDEDTEYMKIEKYWNLFDFPEMYKPPRWFMLLVPIGAQFIVSKNRILKHSKESYQRWYNIVMADKKDILPLFFENIWHILFGEFWRCTQKKEWFSFEAKPIVWWQDIHKKPKCFDYFAHQIFNTMDDDQKVEAIYNWYRKRIENVERPWTH
jgi:Protein of unknown function (DUF3431)